MSQLFWPEMGLQVPHLGGVGFARARVAAMRRTVGVKYCILICCLTWLGIKQYCFSGLRGLPFYTSLAVSDGIDRFPDTAQSL